MSGPVDKPFKLYAQILCKADCDFHQNHTHFIEYSALEAAEAEIKRLRNALLTIATYKTCEALYPESEKYNSHEDGWYGVAEYARQALSDDRTQGESE